MQSRATNVMTYLHQVPDTRRASLTKLRKLCIQTLAGYEEGMDYGMPCYKKNGTVEVAFASQKNYISLYILKKAVIDTHRSELTNASIGKGCIRYSKPEKLDFAVIKRLLIATRESKEASC